MSDKNTIKIEFKDWKTIAITMLVILALFVFYIMGGGYVLGNIQEYKVTGIKSASSGGLFSSSVCVYETDRGDFVTRCAYDEGDTIYD